MMIKTRRLIVLSLTVMVCFSLTACKTTVKDTEYTLEYNSKTYEGKYTGTMDNNIPQDEGKFVCGNEGDANYFIYEGTWEKGEMKGEGHLITNNYISHIPESDLHDAIDRVGSYNGSTINGVANGEGTFSAINDDNEHYVYSGEFKDGLFDGIGKQSFDDKDYSVPYEGHWEKGDFKPTAAEYIRHQGLDKKSNPYTLSKEVFAFIDSNSDVFTKHKTDEIKELIDKDFSVTEFRKNSTVDKPIFCKLSNLEVFQVTEYGEKNTAGFGLTDLLAFDYDNNPYRLYYFGSSKKLSEGKTINAILMPLGYSTYESVSGEKPWAFVGWIISIE